MGLPTKYLARRALHRDPAGVHEHHARGNVAGETHF